MSDVSARILASVGVGDVECELNAAANQPHHCREAAITREICGDETSKYVDLEAEAPCVKGRIKLN